MIFKFITAKIALKSHINILKSIEKICVSQWKIVFRRFSYFHLVFSFSYSNKVNSMARKNKTFSHNTWQYHRISKQSNKKKNCNLKNMSRRNSTKLLLIKQFSKNLDWIKKILQQCIHNRYYIENYPILWFIIK